MTSATIDTALAKQLVQAHAVKGACIIGQAGGWSVILKLEKSEKVLCAQRSRRVRIWRSVDRCIAFMRDELGVAKFDQLDASQHSQNTSGRTKRLDASLRLRRAHQAAAHDRWFRDEVRRGLSDLDAGRIFTHAEHKARSASRRSTLAARIKKPKRRA